MRNRPANATGFWGNPPLEHDLPYLIGDIEGMGDVEPDFQLWLRRAACRDNHLALKLVATHRAKRKANYWFTWHLTGGDFIRWGRDIRALQSLQPQLLQAVYRMLENFTEGHTMTETLFYALKRGQLRGGTDPFKGRYKIPNGAAENGQKRGEGPLPIPVGAVPAICPSSAQISTGEKCHRGHRAPRRLRDNECMECRKIANREYRARRKLREGAVITVEDLL